VLPIQSSKKEFCSKGFAASLYEPKKASAKKREDIDESGPEVTEKT